MLAYPLPKRSTTRRPFPALPLSLRYFTPYNILAPETHDGDTVSVLIGSTRQSLRLRSIDAPELPQPFGTESRNFLSTTLKHQPATFTIFGVDKYHRFLVDISTPSHPRLQFRIIELGLAWVYTQYAQHEHTFITAEIEARKSRIGLWSHLNPIPPWIFRHSNDPSSLPIKAQVLITLSGACFHHFPCQSLHYPFTPLTKERALAQGYRPCALCKP